MKRLFRAENHVTAAMQFSSSRTLPGQVALLQESATLSRDTGVRVTFVAAIELLTQILDQIRNIVAAIPQRWKRDADHVDAIKKGRRGNRPILYFSAAAFRLVAQITRASTRFSSWSPNAGEMAVLQDVQQLCLQAPVELGDFVEEKRSALSRVSTRPGFGGVAAPVKGAFLESEEFAFEERAGNCRAVHLHERAIPPGGDLFVNETRQHFLASAALTQYQEPGRSSPPLATPSAAQPAWSPKAQNKHVQEVVLEDEQLSSVLLPPQTPSS